MSTTNRVLARSALIAFPVTLLVAWMYHRWSSKWTLVAFTGLTAAALIGFVTMGITRSGASTNALTALIASLGTAALIAAIPTALAALTLALLAVETRGQTLEDISRARTPRMALRPSSRSFIPPQRRPTRQP